MVSWMLLSKNDLKLSHRKKFNTPSDVRLATSLIIFECQPSGAFEGLSHHQEDESIATTTFAASFGLVYRINKVVSSNFFCGEISFSLL